MRHVIYFLLIKVIGRLPFIRSWMNESHVFKVRGGVLKGMKIWHRPVNGFSMIFGRYERRVTGFIASEVRPGDVCLDAGSHVGHVSLIISRLVGPEGRVFAVDPLGENIETLRKSMGFNGVRNIELIQTALGESTGSAFGDIHANVSMARLSSEASSEGKGQSFPITTVDALAERYAMSRLDWIKVDVDGFEFKLLLGAKETLRRLKPKLLLEIHGFISRTLGSEIYDFLTPLGYRFFELEGTALNRDEVVKRTDFPGAYHVVARV